MRDDFIYNEDEWPILTVTFPPRALVEEDIQHYLGRLTAYMNRNDPSVILVDISQSGLVSPELRYQINHWIVENQTLVRKNVLANGYIVKNQIIRLALQTFLSFQDAAGVISPVKVFNSLDKAKVWAKEIIQKKSTPGDSA
jgi:hypothetical protein